MSGKIRWNRNKPYIDLHWKGERIRLFSDKDGLTLETEKQADRMLAHIRYEIDHGLFEAKNYVKRDLKALVWSNYIESWIEVQEDRQKVGDITREYLRMIKSLAKHHIGAMFGSKSIRDLNKGIIDKAFRDIPKHLSIKTKYNIQGVVIKIFKDALDWGDLREMPKYTKISLPEAKTTYIEEDAQEKILEVFRTGRFKPVTTAFFRFCMLHGCRPGEARALKWGDIKDGYVTIAASMDQDFYKPFTKTKKVRMIPLHPGCAPELDTLPRSMLNDHVFTLNGRPLRKEYVSLAFRRAARKAGVNINCYEGTRHSWISQLLNAGYSETLVREVVGHSSAKTIDRYKHIKAESLRSLIERNNDRQQTVSKAINEDGKLLKFKKK